MVLRSEPGLVWSMRGEWGSEQETGRSGLKYGKRAQSFWDNLANKPARSQNAGEVQESRTRGQDQTEVREINLGIEAGGGNGEGQEAWMESPLSGAPAKVGKARQDKVKRDGGTRRREPRTTPE